MTDCDVSDATLTQIADSAMAALPPGSQAWVERGHGGLPHRLFVRPAGLDVGAFYPDRPGPVRSIDFYDRLAPARWLFAVAEHAAVEARGWVSYLAAGKHIADAQKASEFHRVICQSIERCAALRARVESEGAALPRDPGLRIISPETMRDRGVSPMGDQPQAGVTRG